MIFSILILALTLTHLAGGNSFSFSHLPSVGFVSRSRSRFNSLQHRFALSYMNPLTPETSESEDHSIRFSSLYEGENVVLTGSTGFVGLRTLKTLLMHTKVENIILPIRVKEGDVLDDEAAVNRFVHVVSKYGKGLDLSIAENPKLCFVPMLSGNYLDGISRAPRSILGKCSTILHIAGSTDWDVPMDELISTNMAPTMKLLEGSSSSDMLPNLKSFVFCSTVFAEDKDNVSRDKPVPEGPLAEVSDSSSNYFSNYAKAKALTEHAIESWVHSRNIADHKKSDETGNDGENDNAEVEKGIRVAIVRPGTVAPSMGLDDVQVGWHTNNKSLAAGIKLSHSSSMFGKIVKTMYARKGVDTGVIPVDHVANIMVLTGGNINLKGINGKPFYLNACSHSKLEAKWDTIFERDGMKLPEDVITYENDLKQALIRAKTELGCSNREMKVLQATVAAFQSFARLTFHDWAFETSNQAMLYEGLSPEYRMTMPISFVDRKEMNAWIDEIMFRIGGRQQVVNDQHEKESL
eukprot:scaffold14510_cov85-Skeletonema_menzelii.AAC.1